MDFLARSARPIPFALVETSSPHASPALFRPLRAPIPLPVIATEATRASPMPRALLVEPTPGAGPACSTPVHPTPPLPPSRAGGTTARVCQGTLEPMGRRALLAPLGRTRPLEAVPPALLAHPTTIAPWPRQLQPLARSHTAAPRLDRSRPTSASVILATLEPRVPSVPWPTSAWEGPMPLAAPTLVTPSQGLLPHHSVSVLTIPRRLAPCAPVPPVMSASLMQHLPPVGGVIHVAQTTTALGVYRLHAQLSPLRPHTLILPQPVHVAMDIT